MLLTIVVALSKLRAFVSMDAAGDNDERGGEGEKLRA
jgi:hypothetical protein